MIRKSILTILLTVSICSNIFGENNKNSFAVVIDEVTYSKTKDAVDAYMQAVEKDGLNTHLLVDDWKTPDDIKKEIVDLYNSDHLEGVVFIGDIPIPMIRNAQHMTSAFKMDEERYEKFRSSIPSDRFYDDFDLEFEFLEKDTAHSLCYYYKLTSESPQTVEREIYSGRIKPPVNDDSKYEAIKKYLIKAVKNKKESNKLDNAFVFTGHGYYSESLAAWTNEHIALREQFPQLFTPGGTLNFLNFEMSRQMKEILMLELEKPEMDLAIFHAHGHPEIQYILDYPKGQSIQTNVEEIKRFLRSKLRSAKRHKRDLEEVKGYYKDNYHVTDEWMKEAFVDSSIKADSIFDHSLDIYSEDIDLFKQQAEVVVFDECFNGSFHRENYIAGKYIFGEGNTIVGIANSVNCLQDKWMDEFMGLFNYGIRIGNWHRFTNYLENHIFGDPTFRFKNTFDIDINELVTNRQADTEVWQKLIKSEQIPLRVMSVYILAQNLKEDFSKKLVEIVKNDPSFNVRMEALKCLAGLNNDDFREVLKFTINDPYELIRRISVELMGEIGLDEYIPYALKRIIDDPSSRVSFNGRTAISVMNSDEAIKQTKIIVNSMPDFVSKDLLIKNLTGSFKRNKHWLYDDILVNIENDSLTLKKRISSVRSLRNYNFVNAVPRLLELIQDDNFNESLKTYIMEALGWFNYNYNKERIVNVIDEQLNKSELSETYREELVQTKNRLLEGVNVPITP